MYFCKNKIHKNKHIRNRNICVKKIIFILLFSTLSATTYSQKLIEYQSGMGTRDAKKPDIWVLYNNVTASHDGMDLYADSAHYNTNLNDFTAFRNIKIVLTDTTFIYGDLLFYNGNTRVLEIFGKEVIFIDGNTTLKTDHLQYDRNTNVAGYTNHAITTNKDNTIKSVKGYYHSGNKEFFFMDKVELSNSSSHVYTDTLKYNSQTNVALFESYTRIISDSTTIYSECGWYNTNTKKAHSSKATKIISESNTLICDTLDYDEKNKITIGKMNVVMTDSVNDVILSGNYAFSNEHMNYLFITDSATAIFIDNGDSLFLHSDTLFATTDNDNNFETVKSYHNVKFFRQDIQGSCDSILYAVKDSLITMFYEPVIWHEENQFSADTIVMELNAEGIKEIHLTSNSFISSKVDDSKFNQMYGKNAIIYFDGKNPLYCNIIGNAQSVYYLTEEDEAGNSSLLGVNVGIGSGIKIYFKNRKPTRIVTYDNPNMQTYPMKDFPEEKKTLKGFKWHSTKRPMNVEDIYKHERK